MIGRPLLSALMNSSSMIKGSSLFALSPARRYGDGLLFSQSSGKSGINLVESSRGILTTELLFIFVEKMKIHIQCML